MVAWSASPCDDRELMLWMACNEWHGQNLIGGLTQINMAFAASEIVWQCHSTGCWLEADLIATDLTSSIKLMLMSEQLSEARSESDVVDAAV